MQCSDQGKHGGDRASASAAEPDKTTSSTTLCDNQASQASSASARSAANKDKGGKGRTVRSKQQGHKPSSSSTRQQQPKQAKSQQGHIVLVELDDRKPVMPTRRSTKRQAVATPNTQTDVILRGWQPGRSHRERGGRGRIAPSQGIQSTTMRQRRQSTGSGTGSGTGARRQRRHVEPQGDAGRGPRAKPKSSRKTKYETK